MKRILSTAVLFASLISLSAHAEVLESPNSDYKLVVHKIEGVEFVELQNKKTGSVIVRYFSGSEDDPKDESIDIWPGSENFVSVIDIADSEKNDSRKVAIAFGKKENQSALIIKEKATVLHLRDKNDAANIYYDYDADGRIDAYNSTANDEFFILVESTWILATTEVVNLPRQAVVKQEDETQNYEFKEGRWVKE